jgi:hypothetical protein
VTLVLVVIAEGTNMVPAKGSAVGGHDIGTEKGQNGVRPLSAAWTKSAARRLNLESTVRPLGRPPKMSEEDKKGS